MNTVTKDTAGSAGWFLVMTACGLSLIPVLGFAAWFISGPLLLAAFVLAIINLARGGNGMFLLLTSAVAAPVFVFLAPVITTLLFGAAAARQLKPAPANLRVSATSPVRETQFASAEDAQKEAVRIYPELGIKDSSFNRRFVARVVQYRQEHPGFFNDPNWPIALAELIAGNDLTPQPVAVASQRVQSPPRASAPAAAREPSGYHYEYSPASQHYVPVRDGSSWRRSVGGG